MTENSAPALADEPLSEAAGATRARWVAIICAVLCGGLMAVVVTLANSGTLGDAAKASVPAGDEDGGSRGAVGPAVRPPGRLSAREQAQAACGDFDPEKPPRIELALEKPELDFGQLKQGVKITKDVTFTNAGTGPLCVARVTTGCGCLKATLLGDTKRFEPGESGTVRLAVDTTGRAGVTRKRVTITCNDPDTPLKSFGVVMDISAGLMAEPRYLQFGSVPPETPVSRVVHLKSPKSDPAWKVLSVKSTRAFAGMPEVEYEFESEHVEDPRWHRVRIRVSHPGLAAIGPYRDRIAIETTHPDRPRIEVMSHLNVVPRIVCRSRVITLGFVQAGVPRAPTRVRIQSGARTVVFDITEVEILPPEGASNGPDGPGFVATFGKDAHGWWVDVKYDGKTRAAGLLEAVLLVRTSDTQQPELRVPIRATVRKPR